MTRDVVGEERAAEGRRHPGSYTFNAFPPDGFGGRCMTFEAIRLGDHAHVTVSTGRNVPSPSEFRRDYVIRGGAGRLILAWHDWIAFRDVLDRFTYYRIAEVENPTPGMVERYAAGEPDGPFTVEVPG